MIRRYLTAVSLFIASAFLISCSGPAETKSAGQTSSSLPPAFEGYHDVTNCNGIMGWALDRNRPGEPVKVDIYDGDKLLETVIANKFRQDLLNSGKGNGKHSFTYVVPPFLKDEKPHAIRMKFAGTNIDLTSTPRQITCTFEQPSK